jgi:GT2 family glycosyltransferase
MSTVAVVIVNFNAGEHLDRTLRALAAQTVAPTRAIVVDNASTDGSVDELEERFPWVEVVRSPENLGFAAGNNLAVRMAEECEYVCLLNPDAFPDPHWLAELLRAAEERGDEFSFFASRLVDAEDPELLDGRGDVLHVSGLAWRRDHGLAATDEPRAEEVFSPCAAAALYRRDAFLSVGGFDEDFFCYFEDTDLAFRLRLAAHRCLYVPSAVVEHVGSAVAGAESDFTVYHSQRNLVWTWAKDMPRGLLLRHLSAHVLVNALAIGWYASRGQARPVLAAKLDAIRGLPRILRKRRALQRERVVGGAELAPHLEHGAAAYRTAWAKARQRRATARSTSAATASAGAGKT